MKLYIKQRIFSWGDKFDIYDETGKTVYCVKGDIISFGKKLHLYSLDGEEIAYIHQKLLSFLPCYYIETKREGSAEVVKEFSFFKPKYKVEGLDWKVEGDFFEHNYRINSKSYTVAEITKKWISLGDSYEVDIQKKGNEAMVIGVVLVIDAILAAEADAQAAAANNKSQN